MSVRVWGNYCEEDDRVAQDEPDWFVPAGSGVPLNETEMEKVWPVTAGNPGGG